MIICFTGIDGSGKTLQAQRLVAELNAAGRPACYVWTGGRAYLTRPLIWLAKRVLKAPQLGRSRAATAASSGPGDAGYGSYLASTGRLFRRGWLRALWQHVSLIEHSGEILFSALPHLLRGRIVVCDRYIYDSLIGIAVLAGADQAGLAQMLRSAKRYPVPRPKLWFLVDLPAAVAFARRSDVVDVAFLERRVPLYREAARLLDAAVVDGSGSPDEVAAQVWQRVEQAGIVTNARPAEPAGSSKTLFSFGFGAKRRPGALPTGSPDETRKNVL